MIRYPISAAQIWVFLACLMFLSAAAHVSAQQPGRDKSGPKPRRAAPKGRFSFGDSALKIPLEIDNNIILIRVRVNGSRPLKFIFDTGASASLINQSTAAELGLKPRGRVRGTATGGNIHVSLIRGVSLSVQGAEVSNQMIASMPIPTPPGFEFDGIIGFDFINQFVVEIDYRSKTMNLHNPRTYTYSGGGEVIPLILDKGRIPHANAELSLEGRTPVRAELEVDTGADGTFVITSPFVRKHGLLAAVSKTIQGDRRGAGGEEKVLIGRVKAVQLGRFTIENPPVAFSLDTEGAGASEENDGVIGGEVLRRFKVIIDYSRKRMILEPNEDFNDPYDIEQTGE
jgi:predicted aspartyl protease